MFRLVAALLARIRRRRDDQPTDVEVLLERYRPPVTTVDDVMARPDHAVTGASAYWLIAAHKLLADADKASRLTHEERARWRLIQAEMRRLEMPL
jgi:hypothetical protein